MQSSLFRYSALWVSLILVIASFWVLSERQERRRHADLVKQQVQTQRAVAILFRAFHTDNYLTYSALSKTRVHMGDQQMESLARIIHAPQRLSITYQSGDFAGSSSGYSQQWAWRQVASSPMIPYAELERPAEEVAAQRFALMLENYKARWEGTDTVSGREVEVVRISRLHPVDGAKGPARKLWIDRETGLTLRQQSYNFKMMKVMESTLSEVNFAPQIKPDTFVTTQSLRVAAESKPWTAHDAGNDRERVARIAGLYPPEVSEPPSGFQFDSVGTHRCQICDGACLAVFSRYTDGLNTLTVFGFRPNCGLASASAEIKPLGKMEKKSAEEARNAQSCEFGTGTLAVRDVPEGHLIGVADLPAPAIKRVLATTSIRPYGAAQ